MNYACAYIKRYVKAYYCDRPKKRLFINMSYGEKLVFVSKWNNKLQDVLIKFVIKHNVMQKYWLL